MTHTLVIETRTMIQRVVVEAKTDSVPHILQGQSIHTSEKHCVLKGIVGGDIYAGKSYKTSFKTKEKKTQW